MLAPQGAPIRTSGLRSAMGWITPLKGGWCLSAAHRATPQSPKVTSNSETLIVSPAG